MGEGKEKKYIQRGREANHKKLLNTENKPRVGKVDDRGKWVMGIERALVGMSTGCCMQAMNHENLLLNPRAHCIQCLLANLTVNYI